MKNAKSVKVEVKPWTPDPAGVLAYIALQCNWNVEQLAEIKAKFIADFSKEWNASRAISWRSDEVVSAQYTAEQCATILEQFNKLEPVNRTPAEFLKILRFFKERAGDTLLSNQFRPCSTSPYHNAEEIVKNETASRFYRQLVSWVGELERNLGLTEAK